MEQISYTTVDKSTWGDGPWQQEVDKMQWQDGKTGLPCLLVRNRSGALCGYVGVSEGHPAFRSDYNDVDVRVHGGLTFADHCHEGAESTGICHLPGEGEPDKVWWLGFDCAHSGDVSPGMDAWLREVGRAPVRFGGVLEGYESYKDVDYVMAECAALAAQLVVMQ